MSVEHWYWHQPPPVETTGCEYADRHGSCAGRCRLHTLYPACEFFVLRALSLLLLLDCTPLPGHAWLANESAEKVLLKSLRESVVCLSFRFLCIRRCNRCAPAALLQRGQRRTLTQTE